MVSAGYDWEQDFAQRVAQARPSQTLRGMFLQSFMEELRELGDETLLAQGRALCGDAPLVELFHYPVRIQLQLLALLMPSLVARHGDAVSGLRVVGHRTMDRFLSSYTGRLLLTLSGRDARRILTHAPMGFRVASNFSTHALEWLGPRHCVWRMGGQVLPAAFHEGGLLRLVEGGHGRDGRVVARPLGLMDSEFDITWE